MCIGRSVLLKLNIIAQLVWCLMPPRKRRLVSSSWKRGLEILLNFVEEKGICHLQADDVCWDKLQATSLWTTTTQGVQDMSPTPTPTHISTWLFILFSLLLLDLLVECLILYLPNFSTLTLAVPASLPSCYCDLNWTEPALILKHLLDSITTSRNISQCNVSTALWVDLPVISQQFVESILLGNSPPTLNITIWYYYSQNRWNLTMIKEK